MATLVWQTEEYTLATRTPRIASLFDAILNQESGYKTSKAEWDYASATLGESLNKATGVTNFEDVDTLKLDILCAEIEAAYKSEIEDYKYKKNMELLERNAQAAQKLVHKAKKAVKKKK